MSRYTITVACFLSVLLIFTNAFAIDHGAITGRVVFEISNVPVPDALIRICRLDGSVIDSARTNQSGNFSVDVPAGEYIACAERDSLVREYYPSEYLRKEANKITVHAGQSTAISFALDYGGWISGMFSYYGDIVQGALVTALKVDDPYSGWYQSVALNGQFPRTYSMGGLLPGTYKIIGRAHGKRTDFYPGVERIEDASPVIIRRNESVTGISFNLNAVGWSTLHGRVYNLTSGQGLGGVPVFAYQWRNFWEDPNLIIGISRSDGRYDMEIPAGDYFLFARYVDFNRRGTVIPLYYNNRYNQFQADAIRVGDNEIIQNIDFQYDLRTQHDLSISGAVINELTGEGLNDVVVTAIDYVTGLADGSACSYNDGEFIINDLAPGQYLLMFSGAYVIPYFYNNTHSWQNGEVINLQSHFGDIRSEAITQDYGNMGLAISGRVSSRQGEISGARLYAYLAGEDEPTAFAQSNASGEYAIISGLVPGLYTVVCDYYGYESLIYADTIALDLLVNPYAEGIDFDMTSVFTSVTEFVPQPTGIALLGNYPNPFNERTVLRLYSGFNDLVNRRLTVYNILGQEVAARDLTINPGLNHIEWSMSDFAPVSGVYFYRIEGIAEIHRMLFLK